MGAFAVNPRFWVVLILVFGWFFLVRVWRSWRAGRRAGRPRR